jgi:hypothetical protein
LNEVEGKTVDIGKGENKKNKVKLTFFLFEGPSVTLENIIKQIERRGNEEYKSY